jgi:hypothetical protein
MVLIWIIGVALALALAMPATAQQRSAPQILERLHALCDQNYKPACIKLGFVIGRLQPGVARNYGAITRNGGGGSGGSAYERELFRLSISSDADREWLLPTYRTLER